MKYGFDDIGGFYVFTDDDAGYAYPSSQHAIAARKNPERTAKAMLRGDLALLRRVNHVAAEIYYSHVTAKHTDAYNRALARAMKRFDQSRLEA